MRAQVAVVGAGPAGLLLGALLARHGIDAVLVEQRSPDYVLGRIRAGVLEQTTVALLDEAGVADRCRDEGLPHDGTELAFDDRLHRIDFVGLTGKRVTVYGQTEVTQDLMDARAAAGLRTFYDAQDVRIDGFDGDRPVVRFTHDGRAETLECDFIAGCDGYHGVCRASVPAPAHHDVRARLSVRLARRAGRRAAGPPRTGLRESRPRLRAVQPAQPHAQPLLHPVSARRRGRRVDRRRVLGRAAPTPAGIGRRRGRDRTVAREEHRAAPQLRGRADALRSAVPRRRRRAHRAADRREGAEPCRGRRRLPVAGVRRATTSTTTTPGSTRIRRAACRASGRPSASRGGSRR